MSFLRLSLLTILICSGSTGVIAGALNRMNAGERNSTMIGLVISLIIALIALRMAYKRQFPALRILGNRPHIEHISWPPLLACIVLAVVATECFGGWLLSTGIVSQSPVEVLGGENSGTIIIIALTIIRVVFIAPFFEEIVFRALLMPSLLERWGVFVAIAANSTLFGLIHFRAGTTSYLILAGLIFSVIAFRSQCLWPAILVHAVFNIVALMRCGVIYENTWLLAPYANATNSIFFVLGGAFFFCASLFSAWQISLPKRT